MDIFLSRLKEMGIMILVTIIAVTICATPFAVVWLLGELVSENIPLIFAWLIVYGMIVFWLYRFINWLFIEPIVMARRRKRLEKEHKME